ncbi:uncharacterized protein LOC116290391 [Actinia tenebrosa]|uniref:Uncharacterized protein LOC116290391 n=1 Tax=Actinia tenebrosa TaxID=6105 RepID=A0A6P8HKY5_ACTTE|nr:uncharacterized protein LOC116290391 [Actinia tenebrosa]
MGCVFHWSQAVWRKVQELGLTLPYENDFIRKLLALPFLPATEIERVFNTLMQQATTRPLQDLVEYIDNQCVSSATFPPEEWSVYSQAIRTNNDVEGWHKGLNGCASGRVHLLFYLLRLSLPQIQ